MKLDRPPSPSARAARQWLLVTISGMSTSLAHAQCNGVWITDGGTQALDSPAWAVTSWDPPGPAPAVAVIGGGFLNATGNPVNYVATWGTQPGGGIGFSALGQGVNNTVLALGVFQGDLVAGGNFTSASGVNCSYVATWNGTTWHPLGSGGVNGGITDFASVGTSLYATGAMTKGLLRWDGTQWSGLGAGLDGVGWSVMPYGAQGVLVGGAFSTAGGAPAAGLAVWNGSSWSELGGGVDGIVRKVISYRGELIVAGSFAHAGDVPANNIARWDGTTWHALGSGTENMVQTMAVYRNDLVVGGNFGSAGGIANTTNIARWDGTAWRALGTGTSDTVSGLAVHNDQVFVVGWFVAAGGSLAYRWARWQDAAAPAIVSQPTRVSTCPGGSVFMHIDATWNGSISYQWRKGKILLMDGGRISGANTDTLTITGTVPWDAGAYTCSLSSPCGDLVSGPISLTYCTANCDCSAVAPVLNANDFQCFLNSFANGLLTANCDGSTIAPLLTANDFQCFLNAYAAGCS